MCLLGSAGVSDGWGWEYGTHKHRLVYFPARRFLHPVAPAALTCFVPLDVTDVEKDLPATGPVT